jgi:hypothetical protein
MKWWLRFPPWNGIKAEDLTGRRFGMLVVIKRAHTDKYRYVRWETLCDCGKTSIQIGSLLRRGHTKSCGCLRAIVSSKLTLTHGQSSTPLFQNWLSIIDRCTNPNNLGWKNYGGRGISISPKWRHDFSAFACDVGPRPSPDHSLDRYPNADGNYEPGNVRWATRSEQARNKRTNVWITAQGKTLCVQDWAQLTGIRRSTLSQRLAAGWPHEDVVGVPVQKQQRR